MDCLPYRRVIVTAARASVLQSLRGIRQVFLSIPKPERRPCGHGGGQTAPVGKCVAVQWCVQPMVAFGFCLQHKSSWFCPLLGLSFKSAVSRSWSTLDTHSPQFFLLRYWVISKELVYSVASTYNARALPIRRSGVRPHDCHRRPSQCRFASASFIPQRYRSAQSHISGLADASRRVSIASSVRSSDLNRGRNFANSCITMLLNVGTER